MLNPPVLASVAIMIPGLYVGRLHTKTMSLYKELNSLFSRTVCEKNENLMLRIKIRRSLMLAIKEVGNRHKDGQFVVGLRDGNGPPTSSNEMMHLTLETISYTLMMVEMIK